MCEIFLRPYQQEFIRNIREQFKQKIKRVVGVAPCGAGKTVMTGWMIREALKRGMRSIFFVHRKELIRQTSETFTKLEIPHGIIANGLPMQLNLPVQIASVQTLAKRLDKLPQQDFLVCDECHHILASTYKKIVDAFPNAFLLGVTATPERAGGVTLRDAFDSMVQAASVNELIQLGNLTRFKYFAVDSGVNLKGVRSKFGEFNNHDLELAMSSIKINTSLVENYLDKAQGTQAICYCVNVKHSKSVAQSFRDAGINACHCDGETPAHDRDIIVDDFRKGKIKILCNAELFGEGFDVPNCQTVILARPTKSLPLFIQQSMRALRPDPLDENKVAVILDHVQNSNRHGLPNDEHNWSLDPNRPKKNIEVEPLHKICPNCGLVIPRNSAICPECGYPIDSFDENKIFVEGDLHEVQIDFTANQNSEPKIKRASTTPEEFLEDAKAKRYKIGWVAFQSLNFAKSYEDCLHIADVCNYDSGWAWHRWQEIQRGKSKTKRAC